MFEQNNLYYTPSDMSWDDKAIGATLLLAQLTGKSRYTGIVETYLHNWMPGGSMPYTPKGLAFDFYWGSLRLAMNSGFLAVVYADKACAVTGTSSPPLCDGSESSSLSLVSECANDSGSRGMWLCTGAARSNLKLPSFFDAV